MKHEFKVGDHVEWNSEAGHVRGSIREKVTSHIKFKTYIVRASKEEPQYLIKSDTTDHMAMHKGAALKRISKNTGSNKAILSESQRHLDGGALFDVFSGSADRQIHIRRSANGIPIPSSL